MVKIISDSTCDLSEELLKRYDIDIIPLHIMLGNDEYEDGLGISPDEIFSWADANRTTPRTSAPSLDSAKNIIGRYKDSFDEIVCFCISESMSTSGNIMRLAAEELGISDRVRVINSENLSTGIGLTVIKAAEMASDGKSADEICDGIKELIPKVRASFVVDTLTYLHRGGRCSGLAALAGSALKLHPVISVKGGAMGAGKKYRGKLSKVVHDYVTDMENELKNSQPDRVFITHSGCDKDIVDDVRTYLESLHIFNEILETRAGGVISSHCGPGTLGVLFISK